MNDLEFLMVIGRGSYGKVYLAQTKDKSQHYAVKSMKKFRLVEDGVVENTEIEKNIMLNCDNPFIVNMDYVF